MLDIIIIVFAVFLGYQIGCAMTVLKLHNVIVDSILIESTNSEVHKLKVEKIESIFYLYDDQNNFICQANTIDELAKLSHQNNKINYAAVIHNDKIFTFVNGVSSVK